LGEHAISEEEGWAALHAMTAAAFGDADDWRASIPARKDDTDLTVHRWVRQLLEAAEEAREAHRITQVELRHVRDASTHNHRVAEARQQRIRAATQQIIEVIGAAGPQDLETAVGRVLSRLAATTAVAEEGPPTSPGHWLDTQGRLWRVKDVDGVLVAVDPEGNSCRAVFG